MKKVRVRTYCGNTAINGKRLLVLRICSPGEGNFNLPCSSAVWASCFRVPDPLARSLDLSLGRADVDECNTVGGG